MLRRTAWPARARTPRESPTLATKRVLSRMRAITAVVPVLCDHGSRSISSWMVLKVSVRQLVTSVLSYGPPICEQVKPRGTNLGVPETHGDTRLRQLRGEE